MSLRFFRSSSSYYSISRRFLGKRLYVLAILSVVMTVFDSLGIAMLFPVILYEENSSDGATNQIVELFLSLGIPFELPPLLAIVFVLFLLKGGLKFLESAYRFWIVSNVYKNLKRSMLEKYAQMTYNIYLTQSSGHFVNMINAQTNLFITFCLSYSMFLGKAVMVMMYLFIAFFLEWEFSLIAIVTGGVITILLRMLSRLAKRYSSGYSRDNTALNKIFIQIFQGFKYLKGTASFESMAPEAHKRIDSRASLKYRMQASVAFIQGLQEPLAVVLVIIIILIQVYFLESPITTIVVPLLLFYRTFSNVIQMQSLYQTVSVNSGGAELVIEELDMLDGNQEKDSGEKVKGFEDNITLENVHFSYGEVPLFQDFNLSINKFQTVAFVGESGAGKSTLIDLLTMLHQPQQGAIKIDGKPHSDINLVSWRKRIGYVTQDPVLFDDTIANNISMWAADYADPEDRKNIEEAARQAFASSFIESFPDGYETMIGDRGIKLSGGQKQRLVIARELFKHPDLLIMDEATSALDTESEKYVQQSIEALKGKLTVVLIAHRLSTVKHSDVIFVLDQGKLIEQGTYEELTQKPDGKFSKMVANQKL